MCVCKKERKKERKKKGIKDKKINSKVYSHKSHGLYKFIHNMCHLQNKSDEWNFNKLKVRQVLPGCPFEGRARIAQWNSMGYRLDDWESQKQLEIFLFTTTFRSALGPTQPPIQWVQGVLSLGLKWPGCEADHSPPSSDKVKNAWSNTSTPPPPNIP
jgi:hypothetical protein